MSAVQESSDAAVEEKRLALTDDSFDQISRPEGVWRDYELKCNLSKQAALSLIIIHWLTACTFTS
jgi:hypothetical protein